MHPLVDPNVLEKLRELNSCSVANAVETFGVRLRNTGFTDSSIRCIFQDFPRTVGYAATVRVRTSDPPMEGESYYYRLDWLDHVLSIPAPRVLVVQDIDRHPGLGAFIGDVHSNILAAIGCIAVVTNGAVRNVSEAEALHFQMYAGTSSVSHAYAHVFDFGAPMDVAHMQVQPGDCFMGIVTEFKRFRWVTSRRRFPPLHRDDRTRTGNHPAMSSQRVFAGKIARGSCLLAGEEESIQGSMKLSRSFGGRPVRHANARECLFLIP